MRSSRRSRGTASSAVSARVRCAERRRARLGRRAAADDTSCTQPAQHGHRAAGTNRRARLMREDETACERCAGIRGPRACRSGWWRGQRARASPALPGGRRHPRAGAWRSCGAGCGARRVASRPAFSAARFTMPQAPTRESGVAARIEQHATLRLAPVEPGTDLCAGTPRAHRCPSGRSVRGVPCEPLPKTRTSPSGSSRSVRPRPQSSETRIPAPYASSSSTRSRQASGSEMSGAVSIASTSDTESVSGSFRQLGRALEPVAGIGLHLPLGQQEAEIGPGGRNGSPYAGWT